MKAGYLHSRPQSQRRFFWLCATYAGKERVGRYQVKLVGWRIKTKKGWLLSQQVTHSCPASGHHIHQVIRSVCEEKNQWKDVTYKVIHVTWNCKNRGKTTTGLPSVMLFSRHALMPGIKEEFFCMGAVVTMIVLMFATYSFEREIKTPKAEILILQGTNPSPVYNQ